MDFCVLIEIFVKNCYDVKKLFKNKKKRGFKMLSIIKSAALLGIDSYPVEVEVDLSNGLPAFDIVGLPDSAIFFPQKKQRMPSLQGSFLWMGLCALSTAFCPCCMMLCAVAFPFPSFPLKMQKKRLW